MIKANALVVVMEMVNALQDANSSMAGAFHVVIEMDIGVEFVSTPILG